MRKQASRSVVRVQWIWVLWIGMGCSLFKAKEDDHESTFILEDSPPENELDSCEVAGDDSNRDGNANSHCECIAATARCSDRQTLQTCDAEGFWRNSACEFVCLEGVDGASCSGECQRDARTCTPAGQGVLTCGTDGQWGSEEGCPDAQRCDPDLAACLPTEGQPCDATGQCFGGLACIAGFEDADGDTWGDDGKPTGRCGLAEGFSARGGDCCDDDDEAHPGSAAAPNRATRCGGADFDCDARPEAPVCSKPIHPAVHGVVNGTVDQPSCQGSPEGGVGLAYRTEGCKPDGEYRGCWVTPLSDLRAFLRGEQLLEANVCVDGPLEGALNLWLEPEDMSKRRHLSIVLQQQQHRAGCHRVLFSAEDVGGLETCDERQRGYPHLCSAEAPPANDGSGGEGGSDEPAPPPPSFPTSDEAVLSPFARARLTLMSEWCFGGWAIPVGQPVEVRLSELRLYEETCACTTDTGCAAGGYCDMNAMAPVACCDCSNSCRGVCRWDR